MTSKLCRPLLTLLSLALVGGCLLDPAAVPEGVRLSCSSDDECPTGYGCVGDIGECVKRTGAAVSLVGQAVITPSVAAIGTEIRVAFAVDGALLAGSVPEVSLDVGEGRSARLTVVAEAALSYSYTPDGSEAEGERALRAFVRSADDTPSTLDLGVVSLDFRAPRVGGAVTASGQYLSPASSVTVAFTLDEDVVAAPAVVLKRGDGVAGEAKPAVAADAGWSVALEVADAPADGTYDVEASVSDAAGNDAQLVLTSLIVDTVAPTVVESDVNASLVAAYEEIGAVVALDEPWADVLGAEAVDADGDALPLLVAGSGGLLSLTALARPGDDGVYRILAAAIVDAAGNARENVELGTVVVDTTAPSLSSASLTPSQPSYGPDDELVLALVADEPLASPAAVTLVGGGQGTPFVVDNADDELFRLALAGLGVAGRFTVRARFEDPAGNVAIADVASVEIDTSPPALLDADFTPASATLGDAVILRLTFDEEVLPVDVADLVLSNGAGTELDGAVFGFVDVGAVGTSRLFRLDVDAPLAEGTWTLASVAASDVAGNVAVALAPPDTTSLTLDFGAPALAFDDIVTDVVGGEPGFLGVGQSATIAFTLDEAPARLDASVGGCAVRIALPGDPPASGGACGLTCGAFVDVATPVSCTYTAQGGEVPAGSIGAGHLLAQAFDAAGNLATGTLAIVFDFQPPRVVGGSVVVRVTPPPGAVVSQTRSRATNGASIAVDMLFSEPLAPVSPPDALTLDVGTSPELGLAFSGSVGGGGASASYGAVVTGQSADAPDVVLELRPNAYLEDVYGNAVAAAIELGRFHIDVTPPDAQALVDTSAVKQLRIPWGAAQNGGRAAQYLVDEGFSDQEVVLQDCPSGPACIAKEAFDPLPIDDDGVRQVQRVVAYTADVGQGGQRVGVLEPFDGGALQRWQPIELFASDSAALFLSLVDAAGNESATRVRVREVEWVATLGGKVGGSDVENPHIVETRHIATDKRFLSLGTHFGTEAPDGGEVAAHDGVTRSTTSRARFLRVAPGEDPDPRNSAAFAWVESEGYGLLFGGSGSGGGAASYRSDTHKYVDGRWLEVRTADLEGDGDPSRRYGAVVGYDGWRDVVVLVGGDTLAKFDNDVWEWDGISWRNAVPLDPENDGHPAGRLWGAGDFDGERGLFIMFGGQGNTSPYIYGDTWAWDGLSWRLLHPADPSGTTAPAPRDRAALAYDADRRALVLFGGTDDEGDDRNDTWILDESGWSELAVVDDAGDSLPSARAGIGMAYDRARGEMVLFGGESPASNDTWALRGDDWILVEPASPGDPALPSSARHYPSMIFSPLRDAIVLFGGGNFAGDTWEWDGSSWARRPLNDPDGDGEPRDMSQSFAMAYSPAIDRTVMLGYDAGYANVVWHWDGTTWTTVVPDDTAGDGNPTAAARGIGLAWDPNRQMLLAYSGELYGWDGTSWTHFPLTVPTDPKPAAAGIAAPRIAYDQTRSRLVAWTGTGQTWEHYDDAWTQVTPVDLLGDGTPTSADIGFDLVHDPRIGRVVLFASGSNDPLVDSTWAWDGAEWEKLTTTDPENDGNPGSINQFAIGWDEHRRTIVVHGGMSGDYINSEEVWEWLGASWRRVVVVDPEADGNPVRREEHRMTYDPDRRRMVLYGGSFDPNVTDLADTWELSLSADDKPGHVFHFSPAANGLEPESATGIIVRATAGGRGHVGDVVTNGASLSLWTSAGFVAVDAHSSAPDAPLALDADASPAVRDDVLLDVQRGDDVTFLVAPVGGASPAAAEVSTDYVEVRVRYTLP